MAGKGSVKARRVTLKPSDFTTRPDTADRDSIVATTTVPKRHEWGVPTGRVLEAALVSVQTATITANSTETVTLSPEAPKVSYLDDPEAGEYTDESYIVGYFDSNSDGDYDTRITGSTAVQFDGTFTSDEDFVSDLDIENTDGSDRDIELYVVASRGQVSIQKRSAGSGNSVEELQTDTATEHAFQVPDDPDSEKQLTWSENIHGLTGVLPSKYRLDIVYYDANETVEVDRRAAGDTQYSLRIPIMQRKYGSDMTKKDVKNRRRKVRNAMGE
jgi:hypothetical protein